MRTVRVVTVFVCLAVAASLLWAISWSDSQNKYILSGEEAAFYDSTTCKGKPAMAMVRSQYQSNLALLNVPEGGNWNDRISCIETGPNASVKVCTDANLKGKCMSISGSKMVSLSGNSTYNNKISSIKKPAQ